MGKLGFIINGDLPDTGQSAAWKAAMGGLDYNLGLREYRLSDCVCNFILSA